MKFKLSLSVGIVLMLCGEVSAGGGYRNPPPSNFDHIYYGRSVTTPWPQTGLQYRWVNTPGGVRSYPVSFDRFPPHFYHGWHPGYNLPGGQQVIIVNNGGGYQVQDFRTAIVIESFRTFNHVLSWLFSRGVAQAAQQGPQDPRYAQSRPQQDPRYGQQQDTLNDPLQDPRLRFPPSQHSGVSQPPTSNCEPRQKPQPQTTCPGASQEPTTAAVTEKTAIFVTGGSAMMRTAVEKELLDIPGVVIATDKKYAGRELNISEREYGDPFIRVELRLTDMRTSELISATDASGQYKAGNEEAKYALVRRIASAAVKELSLR